MAEPRKKHVIAVSPQLMNARGSIDPSTRRGAGLLPPRESNGVGRPERDVPAAVVTRQPAADTCVDVETRVELVAKANTSVPLEVIIGGVGSRAYTSPVIIADAEE